MELGVPLVRAKDTEHLIEQVSIKVFYLKKNNDGRVSSFFQKMGILSFFVVREKNKKRNKNITKEQLLLVH